MSLGVAQPQMKDITVENVTLPDELSKSQMPTERLRDERQKCWEGRDLYFSCLDRLDVVVPGQEGKQCRKEKGVYDKNCAKSWIDHFNKRRVLADQQKDVLAEVEKQRKEAEAKGFKRNL